MSNTINILIFLTAFSSLAFPSGYTVFPLILACIGWYLIVRRGFDIFRCIESTSLGFIIACWVYAITGIIIDINHQVHLGALEVYLPFLIYPALIALYAWFRPRFEFLYIGAAFGGLVAFIWVLYEIFVSGASRPSLHGTPISFGNTGVLIAVTCAVTYAISKNANHHKQYHSFLLALGIASGVGVSLLSGSKGGWISLVTVFALFYWGAFVQLRRIQKVGVFVLIFVSSMLLIMHPSSIVNQRLSEAKNGLEYWIETGTDRDGSVGARLNMYSFGFSIANRVPFFGLGARGVDELWIEQAALGNTDSNWAPNGKNSHAGNHLHNEFLTVYLWKGPFGLIAHLCIYLAAVVHFYRRRKSRDLIKRSAANLGLLTLICYIEFGLTDAGWYVNANRQIFLFWIMTLIGVTMEPLKKSQQLASSCKINSQQK